MIERRFIIMCDNCTEAYPAGNGPIFDLKEAEKIAAEHGYALVAARRNGKKKIELWCADCIKQNPVKP